MFAQLINRINRSDPNSRADSASVRAVEAVSPLIAGLADGAAALTAVQRDFLHLALDWVDAPLAFFDRALVLRFANTAYCTLLERGRDALVGLPFGEVVVPGQGDAARGYAERAIAGESIDVDIAHRVEGTLGAMARLEYRPQRDTYGAVVGVVTVLHRLGRRRSDQVDDPSEAQRLPDVSAPLHVALRIAQDDVVERERKQRELIESLPLPLVFIGRDGLCKWANPPFCAAFGVAGRAVAGMPLASLSPTFADAFDSAADGVVATRELQLVSGGVESDADGLVAARWYRVDFLPGFDRDDQQSGVYVLLTDIHDARIASLRLAESEVHFRGVIEDVAERAGRERDERNAALRIAQDGVVERERKQRELIESLPLPLVFIGRDGLCKWANPPFCAAFDVAGREVEGTPLAALSPTLAAAFASTAEGVVATRELQLLSGGIADESDEPVAARWYRADFLPGFDRDARQSGVYVLLTDIHDARIASLRLAESEVHFRGVIEDVAERAGRERDERNAALRIAQDGVVERERKQRELIESLPLPLVFIGRDGLCKWANPPFCAAFGVAGREVAGMSLAALSPSLADAFDSAAEGVAATRELQLVSGGIEDASDEPVAARWFRVDILPGFDRDAQQSGVYVLLTDVHDARIASLRLEESEAHFRGVIENVPEAIVFLDRDAHIRFVNESFVTRSGIPRDRLIGLPVEDALGAGTRDRFRASLERAYSGESFTEEDSDDFGEAREVRFLPYRNADGEVAGVYLVLRSLADEKHAERAVRERDERNVALRIARDDVVERERKQRELVESLPLPLVFIGRDGLCKWANPPFCAAFGVADRAIGGMPLAALSPAFADAFADAFDRAADGVAASRELQLVSGGADASVAARWYRADFLPGFDRDDQQSGVYVLLTDVHDARVASLRLAESEAHFRGVIESVPEAIVVLDGDARLSYVNESFVTHCGNPRDRLIGLSVEEAFGADVRDRFQVPLERAYAGEPFTVEDSELFGEAREVRFLPYRNADGEVAGVYLVLRSLQDAKHAERAVLERDERDVALRIAQDDVVERERKQRELIGSLPLPLVFIGRDGLCKWANTPFCAAFGVAGHDVGGMSIAALSPAFAEAFDRAADGVAATRELQLVFGGADASVAARWHRADFLPGFDRDDQQSGVYVLLTDIHDARIAALRLEESEAHFRGVIENVPEAIVFLDRDACLRYVNESFVARTGIPRDRLIGLSIADALGADVRDRFQAPLERAYAGESFTEEDSDVFGEAREVRYLSYRNADGEVAGIYIVSRSLEDEKRAERAVRERDERIHFLTDNLPAQIAYFDTELKYRYCNQRFLSDHGIESVDEVIGRTVFEIVGGDAIGDDGRSAIDQALRGERASYERRVAAASGGPRWLDVSLVADVAGDGTVRGLYSIAYDITDSKLAEGTRARQQEWIEAFIENFPQPLSYLDLAGVHQFSNRAYEDFVERRKDQIIGHSGGAVFGREVAREFKPSFQQALGGERLHTEHSVALDQAGMRYFAADWLPDVATDGQVRGVYFVVQDIGEAKQARLAYEESLREMQRAMDSVALPISFVDTDERLRFVNHTTTAWYGRSTEELIGTPMRDLMSGDDYRFAEPYIKAALGGEAVQYEREMRYHDGVHRWVLIRYVSTRDENDVVTGFYTTATDIQSRKKQEIALQQANSLLTAHFENTPLASFTLDGEGRVTRWSSQAETLFGWERHDVIERPFAELGLVDRDLLTDFLPDEDDPDTATGNTRLHIVEARRRDGSTVTCEWHIAALRDAAGRITSSLALIQDVSQRVEAERRLTEIAQRDTLTRLLNRNALEPTLRAFIERARQGNTGVAVLFLDLDHFKNINDTLGHRVGDLMLIEVASILRRCVRAEDEVARIGGDEFMVVIGHARPKAIAHETAQRIITALGTPIRVENQRLSVTSSIGIAVYPDHGRAPEALIRSADLAMYRAKENGKNRFEFFSALLAQRSERRSAVNGALKLALQKDALRLYFQPRVQISDGRIVGAEALLRWTDPRLGVVSPKEFIVIAEESGLIHELGLYVFRKACRQLVDWRERGVSLGVLSVNFSAHQLLVATFIDEVDRVIEETGVDSRCIEVEITETSLLFDLGVTRSVIADLKHRGMRIAIDDFGTGFSSLSHLQQLDVDTLKIDQSFIRDMLHDSGDAAITTAVISLARGLKLSTTAEGVENEMQLQALRSAGCDYYQGFLFSPAIVVEDIETLLNLQDREPPRHKPPEMDFPF